MGEQCRYDGKTKKINAIIEAFSEYEIIPFCPEAPLFGIPRERISLIEIDGKKRVVRDETSIDVTKLLEEEIDSFCDKHSAVDAIVLKSRSPSCGYNTTPILNKNREKIFTGSGIATDIFEKRYLTTPITDENNYQINF